MRKTAYPRKLPVVVEMTFALPEIETADCKSFTACGRVVTRDKSLSKFFSGTRPLIASVKHGRSQRFIRLCFGEAGHLHLDVATPVYFQGRWKPKPTHTWPHIQGLLSRFIGQKIQVRAAGVFALPLEKLPRSSLVRMLSVESKSPKVSMKLTGGTFSVSGAPIQRLTWSLADDRKGIEVRLRSTLKATVNETYLVDLFRLLNESLQVLVLGDEKKSN
ncbi:MAG: hypothetical protein AAB676_19140 [Verrucomicrobiota bacterium]